ncbi:MAG: hypothetical protein KR126chlam6_00320 [Candidatus Anoxychlamydiales bacterium]|nr:hypothetical protein [Candidatus Anoxychlamydiales bacterium]
MKFLVIFLLTLISFFPKQISSNEIEPESLETASQKIKTIVCIHGFYRTTLNMYLIERAFKKEGYQVYNWRYKSRDKMINEHGNDLVDLLNEIAQNAPNEPIYFVTHSMGGLVLKSALNETNCPFEAKIGKAALIAMPNKGSIVAKSLYSSNIAKKLFGKNAGLELMTKDFNDIGFFPKEMRVLSIAGTLGFNPLIKEPNDGKVAISETSIDTPHQKIFVKAGHSFICYSPTVIRHLKEFLK